MKRIIDTGLEMEAIQLNHQKTDDSLLLAVAEHVLRNVEKHEQNYPLLMGLLKTLRFKNSKINKNDVRNLTIEMQNAITNLCKANFLAFLILTGNFRMLHFYQRLWNGKFLRQCVSGLEREYRHCVHHHYITELPLPVGNNKKRSPWGGYDYAEFEDSFLLFQHYDRLLTQLKFDFYVAQSNVYLNALSNQIKSLDKIIAEVEEDEEIENKPLLLDKLKRIRTDLQDTYDTYYRRQVSTIEEAKECAAALESVFKQQLPQRIDEIKQTDPKTGERLELSRDQILHEAETTIKEIKKDCEREVADILPKREFASQVVESFQEILKDTAATIKTADPQLSNLLFNMQRKLETTPEHSEFVKVLNHTQDLLIRFKSQNFSKLSPEEQSLFNKKFKEIEGIIEIKKMNFSTLKSQILGEPQQLGDLKQVALEKEVSVPQGEFFLHKTKDYRTEIQETKEPISIEKLHEVLLSIADELTELLGNRKLKHQDKNHIKEMLELQNNFLETNLEAVDKDEIKSFLDGIKQVNDPQGKLSTLINALQKYYPNKEEQSGLTGSIKL